MVENGDAPGEGKDLGTGGLKFEGHGGNEKGMTRKRERDLGSKEIFRQGMTVDPSRVQLKRGKRATARLSRSQSRGGPSPTNVTLLAIHTSTVSHLLPPLPWSQRHGEPVALVPLFPPFRLHDFPDILPSPSPFFLLTIPF